MKKALTVMILSLGIVFSAAFGSFQVFANKCADVRDDVLRLHIPANSDSDEDQAIKLKLRDYILGKYGEELSDFDNAEQAAARAEELLPEISADCDEFLRENGFDYGANAELVTMYFSTREYDKLILPAGEYRALRITLGEGKGQNWWCVIFPQLCLPAVTESDDNENAENVLESFGKPQKVTVKFAVFEWIEQIFN